MSTFDHQRPATSSRGATSVDELLERSRQVANPAGRGRLIFALDATMSRQPTWDMALSLQGKMFDVAAASGGLEVQLVYFRGLRECRASPFVSGGTGLARFMGRIAVEGGNTQLGRVLDHAVTEARRARIGALVFVGDALEERIDPLCASAGALALLGVKAFMFHEGRDPAVERGFREIARLTGGVYAAFDPAAPARLAALLSAAAAYAAGGRDALATLTRGGSSEDAQGLLSQLGR